MNYMEKDKHYNLSKLLSYIKKTIWPYIYFRYLHHKNTVFPCLLVFKKASLFSLSHILAEIAYLDMLLILLLQPSCK